MIRENERPDLKNQRAELLWDEITPIIDEFKQKIKDFEVKHDLQVRVIASVPKENTYYKSYVPERPNIDYLIEEIVFEILPDHSYLVRPE